jgi:signal transduction histidine kinase
MLFRRQQMQNSQAPLVSTDKDIFQELDFQRRQEFTYALSHKVRIVVSILFPLAAVLFAIIGFINSDKKPLVIIAESTGMLIVGIVAISISYFSQLFMKWRRPTVSAILFCSSIFLGIFGLHIITIFSQSKVDIIVTSNTILFTLYGLVAIIAGLVGDRRLILGTITTTTLIIGVLCALLLSLYPGIYQIGSIFFIFLFQNLLTGYLIYTFHFRLTKTTQELSESRLAQDQAHQVDQIKDQFISSVNHELRTPIMALQGFLELYLKGKDDSEEERHALIEEAYEVTDNLVSLVESILDIRRLDYGVMDFSPEALNLRHIVESATHFVDPREAKSAEREILILISPDMRVWGEPIRARQIITNLLSNAMKYSSPETPIEVTTTIVQIPLSDQSNEESPRYQYMAEICVRDHGLGIPRDKIPLLFQRFVRLPRDLASSIKGNGLGLYLCRMLTQSMGGRIWVESTGIEGEGSAFYVQLPLPPGDALTKTMATRSSDSGSRIM